jgi:endonuclease YncB( thermonuclease family)
LTLGSFAPARLIFAACLCASTAQADNLAGQASIVDGDTLEIHGTRIRLWGVDAPESSQLCRAEDSLQYRCGAKAANELDAFIARRPVDCSPVSLDQYRRTVAVCSIDGVDLAEWLVRNGLALDWPTYSKGKYDRAQRDAEHGGVCGQAATLRRGYFARVLGRAGSRATARRTQHCTHD